MDKRNMELMMYFSAITAVLALALAVTAHTSNGNIQEDFSTSLTELKMDVDDVKVGLNATQAGLADLQSSVSTLEDMDISRRVDEIEARLTDIGGKVSGPGSGIVEVPGEQTACAVAGGVWKQFPNACADSCAHQRNPEVMCAQVITDGCECGENMCWNGASCEQI
ncbi:MAG: hypothetical protein GF416_07105 [Candidatus Altiarchaeales archaeon]|nr:hypothetical protein [Candidatus Altiarchaeales archaeon]MBD3416880.1 hypothetical protein [Candidatus Altiarchaeales archaeon]